MHELSQKFRNKLISGTLISILEKVKMDRNINLEIRENKITLYYKGGALLYVEEKDGNFEATISEEYAKESMPSLLSQRPQMNLVTKNIVQEWVDILPNLMLAMDEYWNTKPKKMEAATTLDMVYTNNFGRNSSQTNYFICDYEYETLGNGRFDLVAAHCSEFSKSRKDSYDPRLVLIEAKYGNGALTGNGGLKKHLDDFNNFCGDKSELDLFKNEMKNVFNQKVELGLFDYGIKLNEFNDQNPQVIIVLFELKSKNDEKLISAVKNLKNQSDYNNVDVYFAHCDSPYLLKESELCPLDGYKQALETLDMSNKLSK